MTAEWSLDKEDVAKLATPDQAHSDNSGTGSNAVSAKYAQQWRYFNSVEDGSRVSTYCVTRSEEHTSELQSRDDN